MRKARVVFGIIVALVIIAGFVFWATFDVNQYRGRIQTELQTRLGRSVTLGRMELGLMPPRFQVADVSVADDPHFANARPFVQAGELSVAVSLLPLLRGSLEVTSLRLQQPVVELIKNREGAWNFSSLGGTPQPASAPSVPESPGSFSLLSLVVDDGQIALTDQQTGQPRAVYSHIDLTLKDFAPKKPFSVQVAVNLPGDGRQEIRLEGTGGPVRPGDLAATPFQGDLDLNGTALAGLQQFLNEPALVDMAGIVTGKTKIAIQPGTALAEGRIEIQGVRVRGVDLGYPVTADFSVSDDLKTDRLTISKATIQLGSAPLDIRGTIDMQASPARLDLDVKADRLSLSEVTRLARGFGAALPPGTAVVGLVNTSLHISGPADRPVLTGTLSAADVQVTGKDLAQPVGIKSVEFTLTPTDIQSNNFNITSAGTTIKSKVAVQHYASANPQVDAHLQAPKAELPAILSIAKAYGVTALDNVQGNGVLNLDMRLSGPVKSFDGQAILRALNGESSIDFKSLRLAGANLSQEISKVAGFLKPAHAAAQGFTNVSVMTGKITVKNGIAQTDDLKAGLDVGTIAVKGSADLVAQVLNLHVNAVVTKGVSQQVGGTSIGGFMKTALANNQGELIIPVLVTGSFQQPKVAPDVQSFAKMKLKGLLPSSANPSAGLSGLVDTLLAGKKGKEQAQPEARQQQPQKPAQNAIQQILEALSEKKKQQQPAPQGDAKPEPPKQ